MKFRVFHVSFYENFRPLCCNAVLSGRYFNTFQTTRQRNLWNRKEGGSLLQRWVRKYKTLRRYIPKELNLKNSSVLIKIIQEQNKIY